MKAVITKRRLWIIALALLAMILAVLLRKGSIEISVVTYQPNGSVCVAITNGTSTDVIVNQGYFVAPNGDLWPGFLDAEDTSNYGPLVLKTGQSQTVLVWMNYDMFKPKARGVAVGFRVGGFRAWLAEQASLGHFGTLGQDRWSTLDQQIVQCALNPPKSP